LALKRTDLAYVAGIMDGEACIDQIQKFFAYKGKERRFLQIMDTTTGKVMQWAGEEGSFTGLNIGIAFWHGTDVPVVRQRGCVRINDAL